MLLLGRMMHVGAETLTSISCYCTNPGLVITVLISSHGSAVVKLLIRYSGLSTMETPVECGGGIHRNRSQCGGFLGNG